MSAVDMALRAKARLAEAHTNLADCIAAYEAAIAEAAEEKPLAEVATHLGISRQHAYKRWLSHRRRNGEAA